jgi:uncharacterized protein with LGFP repeats
VRRVITGLAFVGMTAAIVILPVTATSGPPVRPVPSTTEAVKMGSVEEPVADAEILEGATTDAGTPEVLPTLTVRQDDVAEFSLVGVTWAYDPEVTGTVVQVRVREAGGDWSSWTELGIEDAEQGDGGALDPDVRGGTSPLWTGPSTGVEAELVTRSGAAPTDVQLELVRPGESPADARLGEAAITDTADAASDMPPVYSRAQWGADERLMTWGAEYAPTLKAATLHHTDTANDYAADQVPAIIRSMYTYHAVSRGWGDIGYNVLVDRFGRRWEGRAGGLASTVVGAHAGGFNTGTFGVSMIGNYTATNPPPAVIDSVSDIIAWKFALYGVDPYGSTSLVSGGGGTAKFAAGTRVSLPTIFAHRDVGATACPGDGGYARLGEIRTQTMAKIGGFGSPIDDYYDSHADVRAALQAPTGDQGGSWNGQGLYRHYQGGSIYWSPATGAHAVTGGIRARWAALGFDAGYLGLPVSDMQCGLRDGGCLQSFQGGVLAWSPSSGVMATNGVIQAGWVASGRESGALGYPVTEMGCGFVGGGCGQQFQGGSIYWSPASGAFPVLNGPIRDHWMAQGWEAGPLGYATGWPACDLPTSCRQAFQGETVAWSSGTGIRTTSGSIAAMWVRAGAGAGLLGQPAEPMVCGLAQGGCRQSFEGGPVYWAPATGARGLSSAIEAVWSSAGGESGYLGYPSTDQGCGMVRGGCGQQFQGGSIYWSPATGAHATSGAIRALWVALGWEYGQLGYPLEEMTCGLAEGGCRQEFEGGTVTWSPSTGTRVVSGTLAEEWNSEGGESGSLGYPSTDMACGFVGGGCGQQFQGGSVYWSPASGAHAVYGAIRWAWIVQGWQAGPLGYATADIDCTLPDGGCEQKFQGGTLTWSPVTNTVRQTS